MSEKGSAQVRANHHSFQALQAPLNTSAGFLGDGENRRLVRQMVTEESRLCSHIQNVTRAPFNPVREYLTNRARYGGG
jgi:hypothetical protein